MLLPLTTWPIFTFTQTNNQKNENPYQKFEM